MMASASEGEVPDAASAALTSTPRSELEADEAYAKYVGEITDLAKRYLYQLLQGCGHKDCVEVLCHTGRSSIHGRSIRKYTPRAAKVIALEMCSMANPRSRLCKYCLKQWSQQRADARAVALPQDESPRDASSLTQSIADTQTIKLLFNGLAAASSFPISNSFRDLIASHEAEGASQHDLSRVNLHKVTAFLERIATLTPVREILPWVRVNRQVISKGYAYPRETRQADQSLNSSLEFRILDFLHGETYISLFEKNLRLFMPAIDALLSWAHLFRRRRNAFRRTFWDDPRGENTYIFIVWLKALILKRWDGRYFIDMTSVCCKALSILDLLGEFLPARLGAILMSHEDIPLPALAAHVDPIEAARIYLDKRKSSRNEPQRHLFEFPSVFLLPQRVLYFRTINHLRMRRIHTEAETAVVLRRRIKHPSMDFKHPALERAEQHYLLLSVGRRNVLGDAFDQIWQRRKNELLLPLRVRLGENEDLEIGHDLGGVQIEFFNLVCRQAFAEDAQMFVTETTTGHSYFKPGSLQPLHMFELLGLLLALGIYNGITLPICLPSAFYSRVVNPAGAANIHPSGLSDMWPILVKSLLSIRPEDVDGLDFSFPVEANGLRLTAVMSMPTLPLLMDRRQMFLSEASPIVHHDSREGAPQDSIQPGNKPSVVDIVQRIQKAWPGWAIFFFPGDPPPVPPSALSTYLQTFARWLLVDSVAPQLEAFEKGLFAHGILDRRTLSMFTANELKLFVEGSRHLNVSELRRMTRYEGYDAHSQYIQEFWQIVTSWPEVKQKQLLKFVTAVERLPIQGAGRITFIIKKNESSINDHLPTSSTCFGTLFLPQYPTKDVLAEKLSLAIEYGSEGFGTG